VPSLLWRLYWSGRSEPKSETENIKGQKSQNQGSRRGGEHSYHTTLTSLGVTIVSEAISPLMIKVDGFIFTIFRV
jgi:hypothetical protein